MRVSRPRRLALGLSGAAVLLALALTIKLNTLDKLASVGSFILAAWTVWTSTARPGGAGAPTADESLDAAARALAGVVRIQWADEAALRGIKRPQPLNVRWRTGRAGELRHVGTVLNVVADFRALRRRQVVVLGAPGAGKSVLAMLLTIGLLDGWTSGEPVPVLVSVSSWRPDAEHLWTWLARRLVEDYPFLANVDAYGPDAAHRLVVGQRVLPILDGLDELPGSLHAAALDELERVLSGGAALVVTCRTGEYAAMADRRLLATATVVELQPVDLDDAARFLGDAGPASVAAWQPVLDELRTRPDAPLAEALRRPLNVWLARTAYATSSAKPAELLDVSRYPDVAAIESRLFDGLITAAYPDRPPLPDPSGKRPRYRSAPARRWLTALARHLPGPDVQWWALGTAVPQPARILCPAVVGGLIAAGLAGLTYAVTLAVYLMVELTTLPNWHLLRFAVTGGLRILPSSALVAGLAIGLTVAFRRTVPAPFWAKLRLRGPDVRRALKLGLLGSASGAVLMVLYGVREGVGAVLVLGPGYALAAALAAVFRAPAEVTQPAGPGELLRIDRRQALLQMLAFTALAVLAWIVVQGVAVRDVFTAVTAGPPIGVLVGVVVGLTRSAWGLWTLGPRVWLPLTGRLPGDPIRFLDDAHRRGILRRAGSAYQFRHATLRDHLAR